MDDGDGYSSDEVDLDVEKEALADLRSGRLVVQNSEGTLRCPFSPSRKKQAYAYRDLLQHADGVAKGKRGPEAAGKHLALSKFLNSDLAGLATPPVERVHKLDLMAPQRKDAGDLLVYPWCAIVYNIDNRKVSKNGLNVGPGVSDIREHFKVFNPEKAHVLWGREGHMGMAVLQFRSGLEGLTDAQACEKWFIEHELGRKDWERRRQRLGSDLYGWLARKEDYEGRREIKDDHHVSRYLKDIGDLKDVKMVGDDLRKIQDQQILSLQGTQAELRDEYLGLQRQTEIAQRNAEILKNELEKKHKEELEEVRKKERQSNLEHARMMEQHNQRLLASMDSLKKRCKELEEKEKDLQADNSSGLEKLKNEMNKVTQQKDMQKRYQADHVKLIKKHEDENKTLAEWIQDRKLKLAEKQENELQLMRLGEKLDIEKFNITDPMKGEGSDHLEIERTVQKLEAMEAQKVEFEGKVQALQEENDHFTHTITVLTHQQRTDNDELEEARKASIPALMKHGSATLCIKRMGEIEERPWKAACKERFKNSPDGWELKLKTIFSEWEDLVKNPAFCPFKTVQIGDDKWEQRIDEEDPKLVALKNELGEEVLQTVITALKEIEKYNASGRYPVPLIWNAEKSRRATMKEVINQLLSKLDPKKGVKRSASNRG